MGGMPKWITWFLQRRRDRWVVEVRKFLGRSCVSCHVGDSVTSVHLQKVRSDIHLSNFISQLLISILTNYGARMEWKKLKAI